jgi:hypothetical protein
MFVHFDHIVRTLFNFTQISFTCCSFELLWSFATGVQPFLPLRTNSLTWLCRAFTHVLANHAALLLLLVALSHCPCLWVPSSLISSDLLSLPFLGLWSFGWAHTFILLMINLCELVLTIHSSRGRLWIHAWLICAHVWVRSNHQRGDWSF